MNLLVLEYQLLLVINKLLWGKGKLVRSVSLGLMPDDIIPGPDSHPWT